MRKREREKGRERERRREKDRERRTHTYNTLITFDWKERKKKLERVEGNVHCCVGYDDTMMLGG